MSSCLIFLFFGSKTKNLQPTSESRVVSFIMAKGGNRYDVRMCVRKFKSYALLNRMRDVKRR